MKTMKLKSFIIAALALTGFVGNAKADTTKLLEADGWTKITTTPSATDVANNYYVFVDNSNDLMLGVGKGANQNTKWYSLGVFYYTSVEPTSSSINNMTWTLEAQGNGFAMRNLEYSVSPFQTEWNAAWKFDTNDVYATANDWCKVLLAYADGSWTIQNGYYPSSGYLGPWNDSNFTDGAECAANKSGNNVGRFQIYAISRDQFKQNLLDNASESNPVDVTPWYVTNATFDANNRTGWTEEGSGGNNNTSIGCEIWHRSNFRIYQDLTVPNGKYRVSLQIAGTTGAGQVYGTSGSTTKTVSSSAAAGNNFQNTVLSMIQDRTYGQVTTDEVEVSNGSLQIGMKCETTDQWLVFDNFKLYCTGVDLSGYADQLATVVSECNSFIASGVVPEACETVISNAISTYDKTYETAKEYSAAILALSGVLNTYKNNTGLQTAYAAYYACKPQVEGLMTGISDGDTKTTFTHAIGTATTAVEAATTATAIDAQTANLRTAAMTFISTTEGSFDITFLASQTYSDWKKKDGSAAGIVADQFLTNRPSDIPSFAESYETTCATTGTVLYQTINGLPEGYYQVGMYAQAMYTSGRGFASEASEGDANRTYAFAGDLNDESSIQRTGAPISFQTSVDFNDITSLDVNVHLTGESNALTFGVQKDMNGSNWHFAQIMSIVYSKDPDLTNLQATRDALVAEATGLLNGSAEYLTSEQQTALQTAITAGNEASTFDDLNTVTLTTLPNAINTAKQQIQLVKDNRLLMIAALERFENDYNLADGTDYRRATMSAEAWTTLLAKVNAVSTALDDVSQATNYGTLKDELVAQMDATDTSLRLFKSYKAMVDGTTALNITESTTYGADSYMDTDATEQTAIDALNTAFGTYAASQTTDFDTSGFLGENLDFSAAQGTLLNSNNSNAIYDIAGWNVDYADADTWAVLQTSQSDNPEKLYIRKNWGEKATTLTITKQKMLPVGKYRLTLSWNSNLENMTNLSAYVLGATSTTIGEATSEATTLTYDFEVSDAATPFDLIMGFQKSGTGNTPAQIVADDIMLTYTPTFITLSNGESNTTILSDNVGKTGVVVLDGRTLYKDTYWNTLCLPFNLRVSGSELDGAMVKTLESSAFDNATGTLTLNFADAESIEAGKPYIVKWENASETNVVSPKFPNATISNATTTIETEYVDFVGNLSPVSIEGNTTLYLASANTLYHPVSPMTINSCRAYFLLKGITAGDSPQAGEANIRSFVLNFGDGEASGIVDAEADSSFFTLHSSLNEDWYTLNGTRLNGKPRAKGIYINNGKKIIIK